MLLRRLVRRCTPISASVPRALERETVLLPFYGGDGSLGRYPDPRIRMFARSFLNLHQMRSKDAIEKEKARLTDEMSRGYFADIAEVRKNGGKIAMATKTIVPSMVAVKFPDLEVTFSDGTCINIPVRHEESESSNMAIPCVSLICLSFRASSQAMVDSWSAPFLDAFGPSGKVQIYEVSFIDSWLLSLGLVRRLFVKMMKKSSNPQRQSVYSFGDHYHFRKMLQIVNLLTGYIFLLDKLGRIRWQGFGLATQEELSSLMSCTSTLLDER